MTEGTSICLVTMDRPEILLQTLKALEQSVQQPAEIIIVDNGSTDPSTLTYLAQASAKGWTVVRNEKNLGLSRATNQGLALGKYDCLVHLDDDCLLAEPGWNQRLRNYFFHEKVGLVVPSDTYEFIQHDSYREIRWGLGFVWAMRASLFRDVGGYDPALLHQNEVDLALRVRMAGYHVAGATDVHPKHNDPGGPRSEISLAREHIGCVQFRDKISQVFLGMSHNYGSLPLFLAQHTIIDQDFYRRYALANGVDLAPHPVGGVHGLEPGQRLGMLDEDAARIPQKVQIAGRWFCVWPTIRPDFSHYIREGMGGDAAYDLDRQKAIDTWAALTGEVYTGYRFEHPWWKVS